MKKATFYTLIRHNGESIAQEKTGYTFSDYGYTFNLYKIGSVWCVLEASTGLQVCQTRTLKDTPAKVSEYIDTLNKFFSHVGEQTKAAIKIIADATNKAQATDKEAGKPEPTETEKKTTLTSARKPKVFTKKHFYISVCNAKKETKIEEVQGYAFTCENRTLYTYKSKITKVWYIVEPSTGMAFGNFYTSDKLKDVPALAKNFFDEYGSRFDSMIEKFSDCAVAIRKANGETATKEETKTEPAPVETETTTGRHKAPAKVSEPNQETGNRPQIVEQITTKETRTRAPYYIITRAECPQVWEPCTMTAGRKSGIIYFDIIGAQDRQEPAQTDRLKSVLRLSKIQGYINLGETNKNPVTGTERSHKAISNLTAYAHGRPPDPDRLRQNQVKYYN